MSEPQALLFTPEVAVHDPGGKVRIKIPWFWKTEVEFSDCQQYRYKLMRRWAEGPILFILLKNPSIGSLDWNDPSIAKCCRLAKRWGYGALYVGNVCAYRATNPARLLTIADPVGPRNLTALLEMGAVSDRLVIAHGLLPGEFQVHADTAVSLLRGAGHKLYVLELGKTGVPKHPLFLPETVQPKEWAS